MRILQIHIGFYSSGPGTGLCTISEPNTGLGNTLGTALDAAVNLYVSNNGGASPSITVYAPGANANVAPIRTIAGPDTGFLATGLGFITVL